jgi:hypothetical protein
MDVPGVVRKFHKTLLSWDYFGICDKAEAGGGVFPDLKNVPTTFKDIQARPAAARPPPHRAPCACARARRRPVRSHGRRRRTLRRRAVFTLDRCCRTHLGAGVQARFRAAHPGGVLGAHAAGD